MSSRSSRMPGTSLNYQSTNLDDAVEVCLSPGLSPRIRTNCMPLHEVKRFSYRFLTTAGGPMCFPLEAYETLHYGASLCFVLH